MTIQELCKEYGYSQSELARRFNIPLRTVQHWHEETRKPPQYVVDMMSELLSSERKEKDHHI